MRGAEGQRRENKWVRKSRQLVGDLEKEECAEVGRGSRVVRICR